jgi:hypothetical protein
MGSSSALRVFQSHEGRPDDGYCGPATAVVATESRRKAMAALRAVGFQGREVAVAEPGSAEERAARAQPGVVLWCDWHDADADRAWHVAE